MSGIIKMAGLGLSVRMHEFSVMMVLFLMIDNVHGFLADPNTQPVGPLCYSCLHVAHQRDCTRIVQCGPQQKCVGRKFITLDGLVYFSSGCATIAECGANRYIKQGKPNTLLRSGPVIAGNGVIRTCDQCCDGDFCNLQLCDNPIRLQRCLRCNDVINPEDCNISLHCDEDHICYTEHIYVNHEKRFRMGCALKSGCVVTTFSGALDGNLVGKRNNESPSLNRYRKAFPTDRTYCAKCCTGINCNRNLCTGRQVINQYHLVAPPPLVHCQDYDETSCRSGLVDANFCQDLVNKRLFCPRTCNTCGVGGMTQPVTTTISITGCMEKNPNKCQQYKDFFCNPANPGGREVCPVTCKMPGCSLAVNPVTTCTDPIPACECEYLHKQLQICYDGDQELQKYCCFYCKRVRDPNWVCSLADKTFCDAYEKPFAHEIMGINITCHH